MAFGVTFMPKKKDVTLKTIKKIRVYLHANKPLFLNYFDEKFFREYGNTLVIEGLILMTKIFRVLI